MVLAGELKGTGIAVNSFWPAVSVKSQVTDNYNISDDVLRKPSVYLSRVVKLLLAILTHVGVCFKLDHQRVSICKKQFTSFHEHIYAQMHVC